MIIHSTRSCFDDAMEFIERRVREDPHVARSSRYVLVHGILLGPPLDNVAVKPDDTIKPDEAFAHAWIEDDAGHVWQSGVLDGQRIEYAMKRVDFYREMRVQRKTRYTIRQVWAENVRSGTYGPWRPEYQALCRRPTPSPDQPAEHKDGEGGPRQFGRQVGGQIRGDGE